MFGTNDLVMLSLRFSPLLLLFLFASIHCTAQNGEENNKESGFGIRTGEALSDAYYYDVPAYNFFIGPDAGDFETSILGFGSGFLFDIFSGRHSGDFLEIDRLSGSPFKSRIRDRHHEISL